MHRRVRKGVETGCIRAEEIQLEISVEITIVELHNHLWYSVDGTPLGYWSRVLGSHWQEI